MSGKNKCKLLKEIRQKIADANDIPFVTAECKYQGSCKGTCPKCEEELAYLESELRKRQKAGKCIVLAGLITGSALLAFKGCEIVKEKVSDAIESQIQGAVVPIENMDDFGTAD